MCVCANNVHHQPFRTPSRPSSTNMSHTTGSSSAEPTSKALRSHLSLSRPAIEDNSPHYVDVVIRPENYMRDERLSRMALIRQVYEDEKDEQFLYRKNVACMRVCTYMCSCMIRPLRFTTSTYKKK